MAAILGRFDGYYSEILLKSFPSSCFYSTTVSWILCKIHSKRDSVLYLRNSPPTHKYLCKDRIWWNTAIEYQNDIFLFCFYNKSDSKEKWMCFFLSHEVRRGWNVYSFLFETEIEHWSAFCGTMHSLKGYWFQVFRAAENVYSYRKSILCRY